jgi:hypothetical protein
MFDLNSTLDTVTALIIVLLFLGLVVQAIQSFVKKIFKLKSREIEKSLMLLFEHVMDKPEVAAAAGDGEEKEASDAAAPKKKAMTPAGLTALCLEQFREAGRYTKMKNVVLESISKEDLLKILARIDSTHFFKDYVAKFSNVAKQVEALVVEMEKLIPADPQATPSALRGAASAKIAAMNEVLSPLVNDIKSILEGDKKVKTAVVLGDLLNLRRINLNDALKLLSEAQEAVSKDLQAERAANNRPAVEALENLSAVLTDIAVIICKLSQEVDVAFAALRSRLARVDQWYDTMMQSFEERYNRHMKNVSLYISIAVVIFLNASFFRVYKSISTNDQQRELLVKAGEKWLEERNAQRQQAATNTTTTNAANNNATSNTNGNADANRNANNVNANVNTNENANVNENGNLNIGTSLIVNTNGNVNRGGALQPTPSPTPDAEVTAEDLKEDIEKIKELTGTYESFGFAPLSLSQVWNWLGSLSSNPFSRQWMKDRWGDIQHTIGLLIMVLLLSVGAPFWQDTLESLFGLKNLLRKRSDTRNVEQRSGEGQPRGQ